MIKRIISKVGKRHRLEIDMMEFIQIEEFNEFDLDRSEMLMTYADPSEPILDIKLDEKELYEAVKKNTSQDDVEIEHNAKFS